MYAYSPADYIPCEAARIDVHHRIAGARDEEALEAINEELRDRFGAVPDVVENLLTMQSIRLKAGVMGASSITFSKGRLELGDIRLDGAQRQVLEEAGHKFVSYPLRRLLVFWPEASVEGDAADKNGAADVGLSVVCGALDAIIDSLFTPTAKL